MTNNNPSSAEQDLIDAIDAGRCIAFVGAGLSYPTVGGWGQLLIRVAEEVRSPGLLERVRGLVDNQRDNVDLEAAAQLLEDHARDLGPLVASTILALKRENKSNEALVQRRVADLLRIPFRAILTTNFDGYLPGAVPGPELYRRLLRTEAHDPSRYGSGGTGQRPTACLHGTLETPSTIVMTRRAYRRRLHADPMYRRFLGTMFSTHTVVYIGFSFTDAYVNEVRSEVLTLFGHDDALERDGDAQRPSTAYALLHGVSDARRDFLEKHEGIGVIRYSPDNDHEEFGSILHRLANQTSPYARLARLASDRRILWLDPTPDNNVWATDTLTNIDQCSSVEDALVMLERDNYDLVISHLGHDASPQPEHASTAEELLARMSRPLHSAPVIVFGAPEATYAESNKRRSLRAGATAYTYTWDGLFREIERVLAPAVVTA